MRCVLPLRDSPKSLHGGLLSCLLGASGTCVPSRPLGCKCCVQVGGCARNRLPRFSAPSVRPLQCPGVEGASPAGGAAWPIGRVIGTLPVLQERLRAPELGADPSRGHEPLGEPGRRGTRRR